MPDYFSEKVYRKELTTKIYFSDDKMKKISILAVDDRQYTEKTIITVLNKIGVISEIDMKVPEPGCDSYPFGCKFPSSDDLARYDLALIDLELDPDKKDGITYRPQDLGGGTIILPYLREHAPWLPVIAFSRLYDPFNIENHFISIASSFGFDGQIYRGSFKNDTFNRIVFETLLQHAQNLRTIACMGCLPKIREDYPQIEIGSNAKSILQKFSAHWQKVIKKTFWFAEKLVIEKGTSGFSSSDIFKVFASIPKSEGGEESEWILKVNSSPTKLHKELVAHQKMTKKGLNHAMLVPLLWPNVLYDHKMAVIGYQFAKGCKPASSYLGSPSQSMSMISNIGDSINEFYINKSSNRAILNNVLNIWLGNPKYYEVALKKLSNTKFANLLVSLLKKESIEIFERNILYDDCLVHGDLHCDNIMINHNTIFIDFAQSKLGPIAYDVSKLFTDIILRTPKFQTEDFKGWNKGKLIKQLSEIMDTIFKVSDKDIKLIEFFISLEFAKALYYPQLKVKVKNWIIKYLSNLDIESLLQES